ncbi:MAG: LPP20 family lipoprotein, partial [Candidatus Brocadiales bacterium]|nr:LPP20 family lipoprotein [Candidatus Bathyanammoxibius sp.]
MRYYRMMATILMLMMSTSVVWAQWGAEAIVEENESGLINYSDVLEIKVMATGIGAVNPKTATSTGAARAGALTAARMDAYRRLIETVKGIQVTSETTVRNSMVENDAIITRVEGKIKNAKQIGEPKYLSDTSVEITMEVSINDIMDLVLPTTAVPSPAGGTI